jgi:thiol:disulfide interchange protein DsbD
MRFEKIVGAALVAILAIAGPVCAAGPVIPDDLVTARLIGETTAVAPGATVWVAAHFEVKPGWHIYWRNPGDSGLPTTLVWQLPAGFSAGDISWPAPEHFVLGGIGNYGYASSTDLLVTITAPDKLDPGGSVPIAVKAGWLACADICIPGEATLSVDLPVAATLTPPDGANAALFAAARRKIPAPAPFETRFAATADGLRLIVPAAALDGLDQPKTEFFPFDPNALDNAAEPTQQRQDGGTELVFQKSSNPAAAIPATLDGVLLLKGGNGAERVFAIGANPVAAPADAGMLPAWWAALALAFFGGLILNLMPCVFPVLSLKVLSLAGAADPAERRRHGIAYAAGVVASFAVLGSILLGVRAGGAAIGWGFQLQSPLVVGILAYLLFAMGLSLSGVAEFGASLTGTGGRFAAHQGLWGSFATGVLATVVATPCTAPFMGTALGFALIASPPLAVAVFVAVGLGLAAPFALAALIPAVGRLLPRPGPWMLLFKQLLAFPLYGTVAWLIWVLLQEVGPQGALAALFGLVCVGFAVWVYGVTSLAAPAARRLGAGLAAAGALAAIILAATIGPAGANAPASRAVHSGLAYEPFAPARLDALIAAHKPVFVNLTAAWCLTCLVNEAATLDSNTVRQAFTSRGIIALKGDWTRQDPEITALLQKYGRSGVPLYLLYDAAGKATVLPQILTETGVLAALDKS